MGSKKELLILGILCFLDKCISDCGLGYNTVNNKCVDQDECADNLCGQHAKCFNTIGSYYCQCVNGFTNIRGGVNFTEVDGQCQDINECNIINRCGPGASCINTIGSYKCTCLHGYTNSSADCVDRDECEDNPGQCGKNARCFNTVGRYYCQCVDGFTNIGGGVNFSAVRGQCQDINECSDAEKRGEKICGEKGSCVNKEGSYWCDCQKGFTNYDNERTPCSELDCKTFSPDSEQTQSLGGLANILSMMRNSCLALSNPTTSEGRPDGNMLLEKLLTATDVILSPDHLESSKGVSGLLDTVENSIRVIGPQLKGNSTTMNTNKTEAEIAVQRGKSRPEGPIHLKNEYASLDTDWSTAAGTGSYPGFAMAALLTYKNLERSVNESFQELTGYKKDGGNASFQIFSRVVSVVVSNPSTQNLSRPINITFRHLRENTEESPNVSFICVYWTEGGSWSTHGCHKVSSSSNHTVCSCKHLSSFAVLMARFDMEHTFGLQLLTRICLIISLLCLIICILTFKFCRSIQGTRTTIHLHLCICLFMADLIFLAGISQTKPVGGCRFVAALLHYFFLGVFTWMLLEGVQLYRMVVLVFNATIRPLYLYITGYGAPLVILIISAIIRPQGYGTDKHCWLSVKDGLIWSFFGPVCFIIIVNVFFFIVTVWRLAQKFASLNPDFSKLHKIRAFTVTAIAQMCILGLMWVFGAFLFEEGPTAVVYIFTILNSLQGALVFIMHCLLSKQVREEYAHFLSCICTPQKKRYSDLSSTNPSSSQSQASRSGQQTGESQI